MPTLPKKAGATSPKAKQRKPVWTGPGGDGPQGGVTQSLLGRYLSDKERFRILTVEGLKPSDKFNDRLEFGSMWHILEEALASENRHFGEPCGTALGEDNLREYAEKLHKRFPRSRDDIVLWVEKAVTLFPRYVEHWHKHPDVVDRTPLLQEQSFDVPYCLPSGRSVRLRGKWDSVDLIGKGKGAGIYLQENKTKSQLDGVKIARQLTFDLQTMMYLVALSEKQKNGNFLQHINDVLATNLTSITILGVRYNCVRRAAHKSVESMLKKVEEDRGKGRIGEWFDRYKVEVSPRDTERFRTRCLDPVLDNLLDDYEWWADCFVCGKEHRYDVWDMGVRAGSFPHHRSRHFRFPFGIYNPLTEGGSGEVDAYMDTGSEAGLQRVTDLFPELPT